MGKIGAFLVVKSVLKPADAIVVLAGDSVERMNHAVTLYQEGLAKYMIISGGIPEGESLSEAESMKDLAVEKGVPAENILLESRSAHTFEHPLFIKPILSEHGFKSIIVVSSPYHMRRVSILFDGEFRSTNIKLMYSPAAHSWFHAEYWWRNKTMRRVVGSEYVKMTANVFGSKTARWLYNFFEIK